MTVQHAAPERCFSLYVHIPYCPSKCPYCDFNSYAATHWPERDYVQALITELEHYAGTVAWASSYRLQTIFFGGGTPSLFAPTSIGDIISAARRLWPEAEPTETTLEANPGTVTLESLRGFRSAGVNRLSFGVQSFHAAHLARLGRIHSAVDAVQAIRLARQAGFENVNLDLIFALPEQTLEEWEADLRQGVSLQTDHLSIYNLTYEEGTAFHAMRRRGELDPLPDDVELAMFTRAQSLLGDAGFDQYEISNYARSGLACRHNLNYWRTGAYLGLGAGAHSFAGDAVPRRRWSNEKNPLLYLQRVKQRAHARVAEECLSDPQSCGEFVFLGLRCLEGIDAGVFRARFGVEFLDAFPHSARLREQGLLLSSGSQWRLSRRGLQVADSVFATFL